MIRPTSTPGESCIVGHPGGTKLESSVRARTAARGRFGPGCSVVAWVWELMSVA